MTKKNFKPNTALLSRFQEMNRTWLERLSEVRQIESDFGKKLMNVKSPFEAMDICSAWMAKRMELLAQEQREFGAAWVGIVSDAVQDTVSSAKKMTRSATGSERNSDT